MCPALSQETEKPEGRQPDLFDNAQLLEDALQGGYGAVNLCRRVVCHECHAYERVSGVAGGGNDGIDEYACFKCHGSGGKRLFNVAHVEGNDGALGIANLEALLPEALQGIARDVPQAFDALRLALQDVERLKPPIEARLFEKVPMMRSTSLVQPK